MSSKFVSFILEKSAISHNEKLISGLGGFIAIFAILTITSLVLDGYDAILIVASMGATAVLLFAVPHGPLSQPWSVIGGHTISALIGVTMAQLVTNEIIAASLAVGGAITLMYYLRCIHPPGGATALFAVMGSDHIHQLGYYYVISPILINVVIILLVAVLFNALFPWRRYPSSLHKKLQAKADNPASDDKAYASISHADFVYALSQIDSFIDVSEYDLLRIYDLATKNSIHQNLDSQDIHLGKYYTNSSFDQTWSVRLVVDESPNEDPEKDQIIYKVIAGDQRRTSGVMTRDKFAHWAKHEVIRDEDNWKKV